MPCWLFHRVIAAVAVLTLIELVVVLFIVAVLAGLIIPITGWVRRSANYAALASNQAATGSNLEYYRTTFGNNGYPERLDSLILNTGGSVPTYMNQELIDMLNVAPLNADQAACLSVGGGAAWEVMDHDVNPNAGEQGNPGNAAIHERALADGEEAAFVDTTTGKRVWTWRTRSTRMAFRPMCRWLPSVSGRPTPRSARPCRRFRSTPALTTPRCTADSSPCSPSTRRVKVGGRSLRLS